MRLWFRACLWAAALFNLTGAIAFAIPFLTATNPFGMPEAHPFYFGTLSSWILFFGVGYGWMAFTQKPERLFIALAAACKGAIALFFITFWITGDLPFLTASAGLGDLGFAIAFVVWLWQSKP